MRTLPFHTHTYIHALGDSNQGTQPYSSTQATKDANRINYATAHPLPHSFHSSHSTFYCNTSNTGFTDTINSNIFQQVLTNSLYLSLSLNLSLSLHCNCCCPLEYHFPFPAHCLLIICTLYCAILSVLTHSWVCTFLSIVIYTTTILPTSLVSPPPRTAPQSDPPSKEQAL